MPVLFDGGLVFDGTGRMLLEHGVMVDGDSIVAVAPSAEFSGHDGLRVDTSGGTLLPGLIDCHVHLVYGGEADPGAVQGKLTDGQITIKALENAQATLAGGITAIRDCGGKDYLEFAVRDAVNAGRHLGPSIRAVGRMICMTGGHGNRIGRVADGVEEVIKAVREQIHAGADLIKIMATGGVMTPGVNPEDAHYTAEEIGAGIAEGKRFKRKSASHAQGSEGIFNAVRGGISSIEHGIFMTDECIEEMLKAGTYLVPTLAAVGNIMAHPDRGMPVYVIEKAGRLLEVHKESVRRYYQEGGLIAMGTDAGTPFNLHGANALELGYMVDIGISPSDALIISTRNAADLIGLTDQGTVTPGMKADLLVVDGNPTERIALAAEAANHRLVVKGGIIAHDRENDQVVGAPAPIGRFAAATAGF
ncbi:MAG: amidohydrolase family protein [Alphaproteobacteria bacterium]|nr:amidohydrolase family protein [Alphaproteobacteria bacterium]